MFKSGSKTGTVWDNVYNVSSDVYTDSKVPKYFTLGQGDNAIYVTPNVTDHLDEFARSMSEIGWNYSGINSQTVMSSLDGAVSKVSASGIEYGKVYNIDGWELIFSPPRNLGELPALKHAVYK